MPVFGWPGSGRDQDEDAEGVVGVEEEVWGLGFAVGIRGVMERVMAWTLFIDSISEFTLISNGILLI